MKKNVLITGGNGFIGSHISMQFVNNGYKVYVLCRHAHSNNIEFNKHVELKDIEYITGSVTDYDYSKLDIDFDYIVHVAGVVSPYGKLEDFMKVNYDGTRRLLEYAKSLSNLQCFTYISSTAVYGYYGYRHLKENAPKHPFNNPYSISKLETENLVTRYCTDNKIDYVIIRPGNVFGEYDYTSSYQIYSRVKKQKMSICAGGKYLSCFVYAPNLAYSVLHTAVNKLCHNTDYNVTDGMDETLKEYLTMVANAFGVKPKFINFPAPLAKMVANIVEGTYKFFHIKKAPLITRFSIWQNCSDYNFSIDKLKSTGFTAPYTFQKGIENTVAWFNSIDKKDTKNGNKKRSRKTKN